MKKFSRDSFIDISRGDSLRDFPGVPSGIFSGILSEILSRMFSSIPTMILADFFRE